MVLKWWIPLNLVDQVKRPVSISSIFGLVLAGWLAAAPAFAESAIELTEPRQTKNITAQHLREFQPGPEERRLLDSVLLYQPMGPVKGCVIELRQSVSKDSITAILSLSRRNSDYWLLLDQEGRVQGYSGFATPRYFSDDPMPMNQVPYQLPPGETVRLKLITGSVVGFSPDLLPMKVRSEQAHLEYLFQDHVKKTPAQRLGYVFWGALILMTLYMGFLYLQNRSEKAYLFYALYMAAILVYMVPKVFIDYRGVLQFPELGMFFRYNNEPIQMLLFTF